LEKRRKRCLYNSKERGMLENDLLLGTFSEKYLNTMEEPLISQYELLLRQTDKEIFEWITNKSAVPKLLDNDIMKQLKAHVKEAFKYEPSE
jgi:succinate dehydrogenase flavin-adding protein (antitoxin of CptAB toxin-antitoxin module)